ncbi:MAG: PASTA domain-containing protein [Bacteroidaceae bacterium]|nr:PASTA domain-containing protein [Bacteroidaceae bacterium]
MSDTGSKFKKLLAPVVWGNLLAMLLVVILLLFAVWKGMAIYTHHGEQIAVPDVVGAMESDARYQLEREGLVAVVTDSAYNKQLPAGCILEQQPAAGRKVKSGREILLTVNTERTPTMALPDIADNSSLREAQARLSAMGFKLGPVEYVAGDKDWVYGVKSRGRNVYSGERVPIDVPLVLQVGNDAGYDDLDDLEDVDDLPGDGLDELESAPEISAE